MIKNLLLVLFLLVVSSEVSSQEAEVGYKRKTVINFEDDTIEGDLKTPDQAYIKGEVRTRHRTLIRIRREFRGKVLNSVSEL